MLVRAPAMLGFGVLHTKKKGRRQAEQFIGTPAFFF